MNSDDQVMDQSAPSGQSSITGGRGGRTEPSRWDVKPSLLVPLIRPRRDVSKGLQARGSVMGTGLTSRQLQVDPQEEREQIAERD